MHRKRASGSVAEAQASLCGIHESMISTAVKRPGSIVEVSLARISLLNTRSALASSTRSMQVRSHAGPGDAAGLHSMRGT